ncbi:unnamed protein product [Penicillium salamii]|nr:unnamed protein product [Penicillium salamii]
MRYELKAAAAKILTSSFYLALCRDGKSFLEAGHASRRALQNNQLRLARFGEKVNIQDFMIPVVYSFQGRDFCLAKDKESPCVFTAAPENLPELIGREDDISQLSSIMTDTSFVLLTADIGNGKSILMRHLAWWWKQTKMFTQTAYVDVSLAETEFDTSRSIGILAVAKGIWRSVHGRDAPLSVHSDPKRYLFEAMEAAKGQGLIVLLDGIDRVYHTSSSSDDTSQEWLEFFHVAKLLSITGFKLLVATCKRSLIASCDTDAHLFDLSVPMSTEDVWKLASPDLKLGTLQSNTLNHLQSPDTHLSCTLEVLQYNRAVLKSVSGSFKDRFHGLETVLSWDEPFQEEITEASYLDLFTNTATGALSLNMNDNQGLDRTHELMILIFKHLAHSNRWTDMCALISIGLWTDVMPHPEEIVGIFENADISTQIPILRYIVDSIPIMQLHTSFLPFELWCIMKKSPVRRGNFSFSSKTDIAKSLKYAVQFLSAAQLITGQTAPLVDGKQGYQLHPALTTWLRRILRAVPHDVILVNFVTCMEERASRMGDVNPNVHDLRSGDAKLLRAVESPSFNFVEKEKWNIISAVVALSQKVDKMSSMGIELPPDTRRFAWTSFFALAPISATRDDFCTWLLTHVALKSIKRLATLVPESHTTPLPSALTHFLLLGILNWVIWMAQKYRLDDRLAHPLRVRRLLLARVQAIRDSGIACDELLDRDFVVAETQAWLNEGWIALASSNKEKGQETFQKIQEKAATTSQGAKEAWDVRLTLLDHAMGGSSLTDTDSLQHRKVAPYTGVQDANSLPDHAVMTSFAMDQFRRCILSPTKNRDDPTINGWIVEILTFMETDLDFTSSMRPWYIQKLIPIFTHLRNGNISRAIKASLNGLSIAERDGDTLLASNFRQLSRRLADLDTIDEYDIQQTNLARTAENSVPIFQDLLTIYLAKHDTPGAYEHVKNQRGKLRADGIMFSALHEAMQRISGDSLGSLWDNAPKTDAFFQNGLEGWDQLLVLLEPYKDAKLEDKQEWVCLMKEIWKLMDELFDRNTPEDQAWIQDLYKTYPEPKKDPRPLE